MKTFFKVIVSILVILLVAGLVLGLVAYLRRDTDKEQLHNYEIFPTDTVADNGDGLFLAVCKECGDQYEYVDHRYSDEWSFDDTFHWRDAICSHDVLANKGSHLFRDGFCAVCGMPQNLPTTEGLVTLFLRANIQDDVPEYASLYFAGGATSWGADPCAMTRLGDTNVYYIQLALDSNVKEYNSYKVGFGYNDKVSEESARCGKSLGINWDYVATECGSNLQFIWDGKQTLVDLGVFTFNKMVTDGDLANWIVTGSFADWATTTDNADYIFTKANNFTVCLELHKDDEFKFKRNEEGWDFYYVSPDIKGPSDYLSIDEDGNIRAVYDCKVWITLVGAYRFELSLVNVESD